MSIHKVVLPTSSLFIGHRAAEQWGDSRMAPSSIPYSHAAPAGANLPAPSGVAPTPLE